MATKDARDFSAWFRVELLQVTDPRSYEYARHPSRLLSPSLSNENPFSTSRIETS
jgi:hypothetical protein